MVKKEKVTVQAAAGPRHEAGEETIAPLVDVYETADGTTVLVAEVPGAISGAVEVRVDKGVLTIYADAKVPEFGKDYTRTYQGFAGGRYFRAFALGDDVDREKIEATLSEGVLTVRLPRAAEAKTRKIQIKPE